MYSEVVQTLFQKQKHKSWVYDKMEFYIMSRLKHRLHCNKCETKLCISCNQDHNGGENEDILMYCKGDEKHTPHLFCSIDSYFPNRCKSTKVSNDSYWYRCPHSSSFHTSHSPTDYIDQVMASGLFDKLNRRTNIVRFPFTQHGNSFQKFESVSPKAYLNLI